ncbi:MAG TPA: Clp protease N-terminal domain-containing protein, partial [Chloroflexota bacterium]|nr:Clp protease N-terminal domain-containing protein [Chloroflexota bacterium]
KKVIELAVDEARRLNHQYIGTEHLLLGLVREGEGIAAGVLVTLGVSLDRVRSQVIHVLSHSTTFVEATPTARGAPEGYSPGARRACARAQAEAGRLGHSYLGTGHLLLGLLAEKECAAARALTGLGLGLKAARAALARATWPAEEAETPVGLTTRLERVLVLAAGLAAGEAVDAGHLLLGLVAERDNIAVVVLVRLGASPDAVRTAVDAELGQTP